MGSLDKQLRCKNTPFMAIRPGFGTTGLCGQDPAISQEQVKGSTPLCGSYDHKHSLYHVVTSEKRPVRVEAKFVLDYVYNACINELGSFNQLNRLQKSHLSVLLSGIINTISADSRSTLTIHLPGTTITDILYKNQLKNFEEFKDATLQSISNEVKDAYSQGSIDGITKLVCLKKLMMLNLNVELRSCKEMIFLDIYDHIIRMLDYSWDDENEAGCVDYWKPIFKILFRDTSIIIKSGEGASESTKFDRLLNEISHGGTSKSVMGRRIDLLFSFKSDNVIYELASLEFKPDDVDTTTVALQQNKNLRINKSILSNLIRHTDDTNTRILAMDIKGLSGYFFALQMYDGAVSAIKATTDNAFLLKDRQDFHGFIANGNLMQTLYNFKEHLCETANGVIQGVRRKKRRLESGKNAWDVTSAAEPATKMPPTFFTPKRHG